MKLFLVSSGDPAEKRVNNQKVVFHLDWGRLNEVLDANVYSFFPDSETVNRVLRPLITLIPQQQGGVVRMG